eukprot:GHVP01009837.1.p1 GENE.GHVP01009837.1~~GHVP01009837.1.p1  ORF type:complete len:235 (-),score=51.10 GHVP01009837.1:292-996(-)
MKFIKKGVGSWALVFAVSVVLHTKRRLGQEEQFSLKEENKFPAKEDLLGIPIKTPTLVINVNEVLVNLVPDISEEWKVIKRPYLSNFLKSVSKNYEIVAWTNDTGPITEVLCQSLDIPISGILTGEWITKTSNNKAFKNLNLLGRDTKSVILIDCLENQSEIESYEKKNLLNVMKAKSEGDDELLHLGRFLSKIAKSGEEVTSRVLKAEGNYKVHFESSPFQNLLKFIGLKIGK